ncbi:C4-dicarboxylate ABC transporter substrate-binding protein [Synergistales bacterium]|nr:C4-dicarboxylate ABC transporter substrate-binding protein [Synergistales bacterium]
MKARKSCFILTVMVFLTGLFSGCSFGGTGTKYIMLGSSPATSVVYPFGVAVAEAIMKAYPEYSVTVTETTGSVGAAQQLQPGNASLELANVVLFSTYESYKGIGSFEGDPNPDARELWCYEVNQNTFCVSEESGIKSLQELDGKRFNPGGTGTAAAVICKAVLDVLGVKPNYFEAGQADAADAYADRQIVGTTKLGPPPDSYILQLNATLPVRILTIPNDTVEKVVQQFAYITSVTVPAKSKYDWIDYDYQTVATLLGYQTSVGLLTQEDGYKFMSAICSEEGKKSIYAAYPMAAQYDVLDLTLRSAVPLHPGTVQYLVEKGYKVPENIIPPEYVPVK